MNPFTITWQPRTLVREHLMARWLQDLALSSATLMNLYLKNAIVTLRWFQSDIYDRGHLSRALMFLL